MLACLPLYKSPKFISPIEYKPALWLDASTISNKFSGETVSSWFDNSGNGFSAIQNTFAAQPTYVTNSVNGLSTLRFTSSNNMDIDNIGYQFTDAATMFIIAYVDNRSNYSIYDSSEAQDSYYRYAGDGNGYFGVFMPEQTRQESYPLNTPTNGLHSWILQSSSNKYQIFIDGKTQGSRAGNFGIGRAYHSIGRGKTFTGDICEIIIYNRELSSFERDEVIRYLNNKWGLIPKYNPLLWLNKSGLKHMNAVAQNGETITTWKDESGNNNDLIDVSGVGNPIFLNEGALFSGNQMLEGPASLGSAETLFIVGSRSSYSEPFIQINPNQLSRGVWGFAYPDYSVYNNYQRNNVTVSSYESNNSIGIYTSFANRSTPQQRVQWLLGEGQPAYTNLNGTIKEIIAYSQLLNSQERQEIMIYLSNKHSISI